MTITSTSTSASVKAKKRKRHSSDAGEQSAAGSNAASASTSTSTSNGAAGVEPAVKSKPQSQRLGKAERRAMRGAETSSALQGNSSSFAGLPDRPGVAIQDELEDGQDWRSRAITQAKKMPKEMTKYWYSRYRLFSRFDEGVLMDAQSWFSVTPEVIAARIAARCLYPLLSQQQQQRQEEKGRLDKGKGSESEIVILDLFCGAGGNAIQFALAGMTEDEEEGQESRKPMTRVIAIDVDPDKIEYARHNARIYGVEERIHFLVGDAVEFVQDWKKAKIQQTTAGKKKKSKKKAQVTQASTSRWEGEECTKIDVVFLSPPWGGVDYQNAGLAPAGSVPSSPRLDGEAGDSTTGGLEGALSAPAPLDEAATTTTAASASLVASLPTSFSTPQLIREKELRPPIEGTHSTLALSEPEGERERQAYAYAYYPLSSLLPLPGQELFELARTITPNVALYLPRNCDLWEIAKLTSKGTRTQTGEGEGGERERKMMAVEEQFLGSGLKALAVYCGALASEWEE